MAAKKRLIRATTEVKKAIHEEGEAIVDYARGAKKAGHAKTAKLFRHIAKQEKHHKKELKKALKSLKSLGK